MTDQIEASYQSHDAFSIPIIWVAVAISILVHILALWQVHPNIDLKSPAPLEAARRMTAQLLPPSPSPSRTSPPAAPAPSRQSVPAESRLSRPVPPPPAPRAATPPVLALNQPAASANVPSAPSPPPALPRPPADGDMSALIEARRRARGESAPPAPQVSSEAPAEDEAAKRARIQTANMGLSRTQTFGYDPSKSGGVFQVERLGFDSADFVFFGWNRDIKRNTMQHIEVLKGNNPNIRIAVVRKMIAIIREYEPGDFHWESQRLRRGITLSARAIDNAGLEDFMMREFFDNPRLQQ
jgi:hypothetical protein